MNKYNRFSEYVLYSGGAYGADALWGVLAHKCGLVNQYHIRPEGNEKIHKNLLALGLKPLVADEPKLQVAREQIKKLIGLELKPSLGSNLKARNYYQVNKSECVIAVACLNPDNISVKGGTDVAVQLGINTCIPTYVLDTYTESWYKYEYWTENPGFYPCDTPKLYRKSTLVGTRDIEDYKVLDKFSNKWVSRSEFVGIEKAKRIRSLMEQVFIKSMEKPAIKVQDTFSVSDTERKSNSAIYIFGDNTMRRGNKDQAVIRHCDNAYGIVTKKLPEMSVQAFFTDDELVENKKIIEADIRNILDNYEGKLVVFPSAGLGTGLAQLNTRAPKTFQYLSKRLYDEFGFINPNK